MAHLSLWLKRSRTVWVPVLGCLVLVGCYTAWGIQGLVLGLAGVVMWALLHFTRMTHVLKQAANRPIGHVGSAVMLNAKLQPGFNLLKVVALTRALGESLTPEGSDPEHYRWTDAGGSRVTCEFSNGKLIRWTLFRPPVAEADPSLVAGGPPAP